MDSNNHCLPYIETVYLTWSTLRPASTFSGNAGRWVMRTPVAFLMALTMATGGDIYNNIMQKCPPDNDQTGKTYCPFGQLDTPTVVYTLGTLQC